MSEWDSDVNISESKPALPTSLGTEKKPADTEKKKEDPKKKTSDARNQQYLADFGLDLDLGDISDVSDPEGISFNESNASILRLSAGGSNKSFDLNLPSGGKSPTKKSSVKEDTSMNQTETESSWEVEAKQKRKASKSKTPQPLAAPPPPPIEFDDEDFDLELDIDEDMKVKKNMAEWDKEEEDKEKALQDEIYEELRKEAGLDDDGSSLLSLSHAESEQPSFIAEESEGDLSPVAEDKNEAEGDSESIISDDVPPVIPAPVVFTQAAVSPLSDEGIDITELKAIIRQLEEENSDQRLALKSKDELLSRKEKEIASLKENEARLKENDKKHVETEKLLREELEEEVAKRKAELEKHEKLLKAADESLQESTSVANKAETLLQENESKLRVENEKLKEDLKTYEDIIAQNQQDISDLEKKLKDTEEKLKEDAETEAAKLKHELETKSLQDVADMEKILKDYEKLTHAAQSEAEEAKKLAKDRRAHV